MSYAIKEVFLTLQGEGAWAGAAAVFVRFAGCNVWSGREEDREANAPRGGCARWCDTDFRGTDGAQGGRYEAEGIIEVIRSLWGPTGRARAVLTGGEPLLQVDAALVEALHAADIAIHVETNGTLPAPPGIDWLTVSPKPPAIVLLQHYDEVKVVLSPEMDPRDYFHLAEQRWIQPLWCKDPVMRRENTRRAVTYVLARPAWRLSVQIHKALEIP